MQIIAMPFSGDVFLLDTWSLTNLLVSLWWIHSLFIIDYWSRWWLLLSICHLCDMGLLGNDHPPPPVMLINAETNLESCELWKTWSWWFNKMFKILYLMHVRNMFLYLIRFGLNLVFWINQLHWVCLILFYFYGCCPTWSLSAL